MTKTSIGSYKVTRRLAGPGESYLIRSPAGGRCHARVFGASPNDDDWEQTQRELKICSALEHPALERAQDWFVENDKLVVVYPEVDGKSLEQLLNRLLRAGKSFPEDAIWFLGHQLFGALAQAHSAEDDDGDLVTISHGHLCPRNIGLSWDGSVLVEGLGLSQLLGSSIEGEAGYQAPENRTTPRGDMYSGAAILWAMLACEKPSTTGERLVLDNLDIPAAVADSLGRALEPSLGKRKITSMELEHTLADLVDPEDGASALQDALGLLRKGGTLLGTGPAGLAAMLGRPGMGKPGSKQARPAGRMASPPKIGKLPSAAPPPKEPTPKPGDAKTSSKLPPLRSKQPTLLGGKDGKKDAPATKRQELDWDTEPTTAFERDVLKEIAEKEEQVAKARASKSAPADKTAEEVLAAAPEELMGAVVESPKPAKAKPKAPRIPKLSSIKPPKLPGATKAEFGRKTGDKGTPSPGPSVAKSRPPALPKSPTPPRVDKAEKEQPEATQELKKALAGSAPADSPSSDKSSPVLAGDKEKEKKSPTTEKPAEKPAVKAAAPESKVDEEIPAPPAALGGLAATLALPDVEPPPDQDDIKPKPEPKPKPVASPVPKRETPVRPAPAVKKESPWETGTVEPEPVKKLGMGTAILVALVTAGLVMGVGIWWMNRQANVRSQGTTPSAVRTAKPKPRTTVKSKSTALKVPSARKASPSASTAVSASPSAEPTASAEAATPDDGDDGSSLLRSEGYLIVSYAGEQGGQVFTRGKLVGPVGQKLKVACGKPTFVRIGKKVGGLGGTRWLSDGQTVVPKCQSVTELAMKAKR